MNFGAQDRRCSLLTTALVVTAVLVVATTTARLPQWRSGAREAVAEQAARAKNGAPIPAEVPWANINPSRLKLPPSSFECTDADAVYQTCLFHNLVLYRGVLTYIVKDDEAPEAVRLPNPVIFEVGNSPSNDYSLPKILSVRTAAGAGKELAAAADKSESGALRVAHFASAIFQRTRTFDNWFWALNGAGNVYHRLCQYQGLCSAAEVRGAAILQPIIASSQNLSDVDYVGLPLHHSRAARDLMACFGPLFWVNHGSWRQMKKRSALEVVTLGRVLVGVGPDVVQPKAAPSADGHVRYAQANTSMALRRVRFLRRCAGLPPVPAPRPRPSVLLVNRPYADGRSILGLDDVADRLRRALPADVPLAVYLPRGEAGLAEQAAVFDSAAVVVAPHGAATANFNFLPHDAVALGVFALPGRFAHDAAVAASLPAPPYNVTVLPVSCAANRTEPRVGAARLLPEFVALPRGVQYELLYEGRMDRALAERVHQLLGMSLLDWMEFRTYHPDPEALANATLDALSLWQEKADLRRKRWLQQRRRGRRRVA